MMKAYKIVFALEVKIMFRNKIHPKKMNALLKRISVIRGWVVFVVGPILCTKLSLPIGSILRSFNWKYLDLLFNTLTARGYSLILHTPASGFKTFVTSLENELQNSFCHVTLL